MAFYRVIPLQSGDFSIQSDSGYLHSRRNPRKEASRVAQNVIQNSGISKRVHGSRPIHVLCVNPGLGYIAQEILNYYPHADIYGIYSDPRLLHTIREQSPDLLKQFTGTVFSVSSPRELTVSTSQTFTAEEETFLESLFSDLRIMNSLVIPWPGARNVPGNDALLSGIQEIMASSQKQLQTKMFFGPLWIRNYRKNLARLSSANSGGAPPGRPMQKSRSGQHRGVILCASGPSLEEVLPLLKKHLHELSPSGNSSSRPEIWALPSALRALNYWEIPVDSVVSIDGGYWAGVHLRYAASADLIRISLSAAMPERLHSLFHGKIALFSLKMPFEMDGCALETSPERGSVLFTALDLIRARYRGNCIVIGADFARSRGRSHCRPHSFDEFISSRTCRTSPLETEMFRRSMGDQLDMYARWFQAHVSAIPGVYRLRLSGKQLDPREGISAADAWKILETSPPFPDSGKDDSVSAPSPGAPSAGASPVEGCGIYPPPSAAECSRLFSRYHSRLDSRLPSQTGSRHPESEEEDNSWIIVQRLVYSRGIALKHAHGRWLSGEDEEECIARVLENDFKAQRKNERNSENVENGKAMPKGEPDE
ncbi:hypothetical protein [Salinispira pacifica]|uniref:DUF115 domain-containing protein n=1 Tax=Salinispira pacifica TaxID=1307761 RepID=V5WHL0_9SPIO|nr:hypothetical protein [Salinispira pacifica]AHC15009.1 hypothetical protein L21SP2_1624 [Salinispira pacifica]